MKRQKLILLGVVVILITLAVSSSQMAVAAVLDSQDFNSLSAGTYTTDSLATGSQLTNTGANNSGGPGLDFNTYWVDTRGESAGPVTATFDSSDFIGVNSYAGSRAPNVAPDGTPVADGSEHNFEFNDCDGRCELRFEPVDMSGKTGRVLSLYYWIADTGYEPDDELVITVSDGSTDVQVLFMSEPQLEANASPDNGSANWNHLLVDLDAVISSNFLTDSNILLTIGVDNNSSAENIFVDDISLESGFDLPPEVDSTTPAGGDTFVAVDSDITVTFSEPVTVSGNWAQVDCGNTGTQSVGAGTLIVTDTDPTFTLNPVTDFSSDEICTATIFAAGVADGDSVDPPDNLVEDFHFNFSTGVATHYIHEVQGSTSSTPLSGQGVAVTGIVVGDYQGGDQLRGFFIQEEDADADNDLATSEGIFVYCGGCWVDVGVGDQVTVTGTASEYFGMSQISASEVTLNSSGNPLPTAATIDLPIAGDIDAFYESFEGMLVNFVDDLYVSEYYQLARYGEVVLFAGGRPYHYTHVDDTPTAAEYQTHLADLASRRVILDDDDNQQNSPLPDGVFYHPQPDGFGVGTQGTNFFRGDDIVSNLTGVLHWSYAGQFGTDAWRIRPVDPAYTASFSVNNPRPMTAPNVGGSLTVASFNVLNYFDGPFPTSRGAHSSDEFVRQTEKIVAALLELDADVVGVMEIQNNDTALPTLVNALNDDVGADIYSYIDVGVIGSDEIAVGILYRTAAVAPVGEAAVLDTPAFLDPNHTGKDRNRPAVAVTFTDTNRNSTFTVVVNHLKSKGSGCGSGDDDTTTGQGNCNLTRTLGAQELVRWLAGDPTDTVTNLGKFETDILIIGDLNAYAGEDPIDAIRAGAGGISYTDLLGGVGSTSYSYLFDGQLGYLDYALASNTLHSQVTGAEVWHINADEVPVFDYNDTVVDAGEAYYEAEPSGNDLYEPNPFRASDHDPVIAGLELNDPPICGNAYPSVTSLWPVNHKLVSVDVLGVTDPNGDPLTYTIDSIFQDEPVDADDDGATAPDGLVAGPSSVELRAERYGESNGRAYHVSFTATDDHGGACSGVIQVLVPLSKGKDYEVIDDGPLYDSTANEPE